MGRDAEAFIAECYEKEICPCCKNPLSGTERYGGGRKEDGLFCSLDHYTRYHERELIERHKQRLKDRGTERDE